MKPIDARIHGAIDYLSVVALVVLALTLDLPPVARSILLFLAGAYLIVTLCTRFPFGILRVIPFPTHGAIELASAGFLIVSPWLLGFSNHLLARWLYVGLGIVVIAVFSLTDWRDPEAARIHPVS